MAKNVLLSQGLSILHFPDVASSIESQGNKVSYISGFVPKTYHKSVINFIGNLLHKKNLYLRLLARKPLNFQGNIISLKYTEAYFWIMIILSKTKLISLERANATGWKIFGKQSGKYVSNQDIFHVRSGAGQGGAITNAKNNNIIVVADHSIAHPATMELNLRKEYDKFGLELDLNPNDEFWKMIMADCEQSNYIVVNSDYVAQTFIENGISGKKIKVLYWGVRQDFVGLKTNWEINSIPRLIFTGTFGIRKGAHVLIEAVKKLNSEGFSFVLDIAGPDEFTEVAKETLPSNVNFLGNLLQEDLKMHLVSSDAYVFPTFAEGCARSVMEAMAIGLPVITTINSGAPIVNGESGFLVSVGSADELADTIRKVLSDKNLRQTAGQKAADLIKKEFNWQNYALQLKDFYNEICNN